MDQSNKESGGEISIMENEVHALTNEIKLKTRQ